MLIPFDDYPIHQTPLPLGQPGYGNPHHYDRFWFNGFRDDLIFGVAFCSYPNRQIMDGAFSVVHGGVQHSVFASGRINRDPVATHMGPIRIEIVEPMRVNRVIVDAPDHGLIADLTYTAHTAVVEESRQICYDGARLFMDTTRATQWGTWTGSLEVDGYSVDLGAGVHATKDRSWGARTIHSSTGGATQDPPEVLFLWSPIHFDDECLHFLVFENPDGSRWAQDGFVVTKIGPDAPVFGPGTEPTQFAQIDHHIDWLPGQRRARGARLTVRTLDGQTEDIRLEPLMTFQMKGIGYGHPFWGHGNWHGEHAVGGESYPEGTTDPMRPENIHIQQVVRASWRGKQGLGVLEQVLLGPHYRYGFADYLDGAPGIRTH
ncbi:hypothetical protein [Nocardia gamkensis]|uniref:hypothetical protein n=1 Tax=Nocardia gamkensis TaxID=352869 RepID=UPI0037C6B671